MTTIHNIPPKILSHAFSLVEGTGRISTLKNLALVCKDWVRPAQEQLWDRVDLDTDRPPWKLVEKFTASGTGGKAKVFRTRELSLSGRMNVENVRRVLLNCRDLESLTLGDQRLDLSVLCHPGLESKFRIPLTFSYQISS